MRSLFLIYPSVNPPSLHSLQFGTDSSEMISATSIGAFSQLKNCQKPVSALGKQFLEQTQGFRVRLPFVRFSLQIRSSLIKFY